MEVPNVTNGRPEPGRRVRYSFDDDESHLYSVLHLPTDWQVGKRYPLVVEYPGNIFFTPLCYSTGLPDHCIIGYE